MFIVGFAKESQLPIKRVLVKPVPSRTPDGLLRVHGTVEFVLEMSEWIGKLRAFVVDLEGTDFNIVLGMGWDLQFTVETNTGTKHICRLQTTPELQDFNIDNPKIQVEFNLISFDEPEKDFRKEQLSNRVEDKVYTVLYHVHPLGPEKLKRNRRMHR